MKNSFSTKAVLGAAAAAVWAGSTALAGNINTLTSGTDLSVPANWSLGTVPTIADDAVIGTAFPTTTATLTLTGSSAGTFTGSFNSLNVTNTRVVTIANFTGTNPNTATLTLGGAGSTANSFAPTVTGLASDLLFVGNTSTLTLSSVAGTAALNLVAAQTGSFTIGGTANIGGALTVASGTTLTANVVGTLNLNGSVTVGAGTTLIKTGAGTLNLNGTNSTTFAGALTVNQGLVDYGSAASAPRVGTAVTLGGGTLQYSNAGNADVVNNGRYNITLTAGTTSALSVNNTSTNGNRLINRYGTGGVIISGDGNLTITGSTVGSFSAVAFTTANTYTGTTNVGPLQMLLLPVGGSAVNSTLNLSGGTFGVGLNHAAGQVVAGVNLGAGAASNIQTYSSSLGTVTAATTGAGAYALGPIARQTGGVVDVFTSGFFSTTNANTGTGGIAGGYLTTGNGAAFGTIGAGGVISAYTGYTAASADYAAANAGTDFDAAATGTFANSTVNSVRFAAAAPVTASSPALTVASGGILVTNAVGANATSLAGGTITSGNGQDLIVHQYNNVAGGATTISSAIVDNGGTSVGLTKTGAGTLILDGANTFTGRTFVQGGTLQIGNNSAGGNLNFAQPIVNNGAITVSRSDNVTIGGLISGTGTLLKTGSNVLTLTNANTFTGQIEVAQGVLAFPTTLAVNGNSTASRLLIDDGAAIRFTNTGNFILQKGITLNGGSGTIDVSNAGILTANGTIIPPTGGSGTLIKTGTGTLALGGANTYTGVLIAAGTLRLNSTGGLGASGVTTAGTPIVNEIADGATLEFNAGTVNYTGARNFLLGGPNTTLQVNTGTASIASAAFVSGPGTLNKTGSGALSLSSTSNSYTGGTVVKAGTLTGAAGAFGTGDVTVSPSGTANAVANSNAAIASTANVTVNNNGSALGTLNITNATPTIGSLAGTGQVSLGTATLLTVGNGTSTTFSGVISGGANSSITKVGSSTLTLTGANTYGGTTTVASTNSTLSVKYTSTGVSAATPLLTNAGGTDIQNGTVVFDYTGDTSPAATIRGLLKASFDEAGTPGIMETGQIRSTTSTAARGLGYRDTGTAVIVKATLFGDADLDGGVSINDFNALAGNFGVASGKVWTDGDFDYDGGVSINDFNLLAGGFGQSLPASSELWSGLLAFAAAHNDLAAFEAVTGVPEPTSLGLLAAGVTLGLRRRRRECDAAQRRNACPLSRYGRERV